MPGDPTTAWLAPQGVAASDRTRNRAEAAAQPNRSEARDGPRPETASQAPKSA